MNEIIDKVLFKYGNFIISIQSILEIIIVFLLAKLLIVIIQFSLNKHLKKQPENNERLNSIFQLLKYFIWTITIAVVLEIMGINLTILLAGSAALLVGLGLGIQQTFNDLISGIIILAEGSLKKNDVVEVDALIGRVEEINLRTSIIYTRDGINIIVPNHKFINENVINWSHNSKATRFKIHIGVAYGSNEIEVQEVLHNCLLQEEKVIKNNPTNYPIFIRIVDFGDSAINFELLFWSNDIFSIEQIKSNIRFSILEAFRKNNIVIPFPQRDVHIKQD